MNLHEAIILGAVQGLTEFLPISSSAHLQFVPWLFGWANPSLSYDAALHLGTALAVLIFFFKEIYALAVSNRKLAGWLILSNLPAVFIGYFAQDTIEANFHQSTFGIPFMATGLILFGLIIYFVDKHAQSDLPAEKLNLKQYLLLGVAQSLALIPGVSRSGITITAGRALRLSREEATRVSFLLGIPITFGASLHGVLKVITAPVPAEPVQILVVGTLSSFLVGMLAIKWLLAYVRNHPLAIFSWYRLILGTSILLLWASR
ncbi:MAG: undecaprenyl-diphosphatase [Patescibacteria group bacterium]|nr:MAG: undecaprenyl-diphosphatase [Patescibacteria group bacterium]